MCGINNENGYGKGIYQAVLTLIFILFYLVFEDS